MERDGSDVTSDGSYYIIIIIIIII